MLNVGGGELLLILLVALIVLGPDKLPDAARQAGKVMREFRRISSGFQREMREAMKDPVTAATQERKLDNRVSFEPPPPFASQKADPDPDSEAIDEADPDGNDPAEVSEATDAAAGAALDDEDAAVADSARAGAEDEDTDDEGAGPAETPDDPEVGIPSDR